MEQIFTFQNMITLLFLIVYGIIFFIQKSQFKKQSEILNKYEKIFNIINVDEIEKYVQLQKKATELSFTNRQDELEKLEKKYNSIFNEVDKILESSKSTIEKSEEIKKELTLILERNRVFISNLTQLSLEEFEEIYKILKSKLPTIKDKKLLREIESGIEKIAKKYYSLKKVELEKL